MGDEDRRRGKRRDRRMYGQAGQKDFRDRSGEGNRTDRRYGQYNPVVHRRRRKLLCYHCRSKKAAEPGAETAEEKTEEVTKTILIDGEEVTLKAEITYRTEQKAEEQTTDLSYEGYNLKWEDQFDGETLNRDDWNVELHDPGWVNNELQSYVDSSILKMEALC